MQKITLKSVTAILCSLLKKNFNNRRLKKTIYTAVLFLFLSPLQAQQPALKSITIGDTVPDITITHVYNYHDSTIKLSGLKGKLVILDFWATWCSGCVQELPKLDSLQKEFANKMQILLINQEGSKTKADDETRIKAFFSKWKEKYNSVLPQL